jgi:alkanesulfonate monooxygenase SsuD/methylene tetrahydromethanopterin reductase-like flavin-dependent oxidoreductase (luciferase family)
MASTLDVISEGRLEFGIGACWSEDECIDRGIDWPKPSTRIGMLREAVEVCKNLWTREKSTYKGKYYQLEKVFSEPKPLQKPYPPIMIGGGGEQLTLKLVAQHADKSNFGGPVDVVKRKLEILKEHCEKNGRDFNEIEKTMNIGVVVKPTYEEYVEDMKKRWTANGRPDSFDDWFGKTDSTYVSGTPEDCINQIQQYVEIGIKLIIIRVGDLPDLDGLRLFSEKVVPHFT